MRAFTFLAVALVACTTNNTTIVYVSADAPDDADADTAVDSAKVIVVIGDAFDAAREDLGTGSSIEAASDTPLEVPKVDSGHVRCEVDGGAIFEGCNGTFAEGGLAIEWFSSDGTSGRCPSLLEGVASPVGDCRPDAGAGTLCLLQMSNDPSADVLRGKCR